MATQTGSDAVFVQYRPGRRRWLVLVAAFAAALLLLTGLYAVRWVAFSPSAVVTAYFDALADRDAAAALRAVAPEVAAEAPPDLLTDAVLAAADYAPPADLEVLETTVDGRSGAAEVAFTISGRRYTTWLRLRRDDGLVDTVFQRWRVVDAIRPLPVGAAPGELAVNGVPVATSGVDGQRQLLAFFGGYEVGVPAGDPLWDERRVTLQVGPDSGRRVDVPMVARPQTRAEVERQLVAVLDECAASTELIPPGCPFSNTRYARATDVSWRIEAYPRVVLEPGVDPAGQAAMLVRTSTNGEAVVTGVTPAFGGTERPFEIVVPFPVSGVVTAGEGGVGFQPDW